MVYVSSHQDDTVELSNYAGFYSKPLESVNKAREMSGINPSTQINKYINPTNQNSFEMEPEAD